MATASTHVAPTHAGPTVYILSEGVDLSHKGHTITIPLPLPFHSLSLSFSASLSISLSLTLAIYHLSSVMINLCTLCC